MSSLHLPSLYGYQREGDDKEKPFTANDYAILCSMQVSLSLYFSLNDGYHFLYSLRFETEHWANPGSELVKEIITEKVQSQIR